MKTKKLYMIGKKILAIAGTLAVLTSCGKKEDIEAPCYDFKVRELEKGVISQIWKCPMKQVIIFPKDGENPGLRFSGYDSNGDRTLDRFSWGVFQYPQEHWMRKYMDLKKLEEIYQESYGK